QQTNAMGNSTTFGYDALGCRVVQQDGIGNRWTYGRDIHANLLSLCDPLGRVTTYSAGADPSLRQVQTVIDPVGRRTTYNYLPSGLAQSRQDGMGGVMT